MKRKKRRRRGNGLIGARVIIVGGGFAFASHNGTVGLPTSSLTITDDKITDPKNASEFVVRIYGNKIALQLGSKYLAYQKMEDVARKQVYVSDDFSFFSLVIFSC